MSKNPPENESLCQEPLFKRALSLSDNSKKGHPSPEDSLLSYFISLLKDEQPDRPHATAADWPGLIEYLGSHWLVPYIYWKIGHLPRELRPPDSVVSQMRERFLAGQARYLTMERQLSDILDAFVAENISALVIKGPALALTLYPSPAARPCSDIDLLVRPDEYLKARSVLDRIGYRCGYRRFENFRELFNSEPFSHRTDSTKPYEVDLHWNIFQYHGLKRGNDADEFFDRKITVETPRLTFHTLGTVDALIQAAFHLVLHHPESLRLIWISDIALLCQKLVGRKDWEDFFNITSEFKLNLAMKEALKLAHLWFGLQVQEEYEGLMQQLKPEETEKNEWDYLTNPQATDIRINGYLENFRKSPNKIRYLMNFLLPSPEYIKATFPPSKIRPLPFSYIRRWVYWFAKFWHYGVQVLRNVPAPKRQ